MDTLYIVIPAYNESENIKRTIEEWCPVVEKHNGGGASRLVIINDGSRDDTYEIASAECETHPLLTVLTKPNGGHGSTVLYGYRYALENGADYIFQTDSDGQTDPAEFEKFWQIREGYDAIFGNRTSRGDGFSRAVVEKVLCAVLWTYFHVSVPDANAPFRLMKTDYVAEYLPLMPENYNLPNALLTAFGAYFHRKIRFIPISFKPRQGGTNSINIRKIVKIGRQALHDFCEIQKAAAKKREGTYPMFHEIRSFFLYAYFLLWTLFLIEAMRSFLIHGIL